MWFGVAHDTQENLWALTFCDFMACTKILKFGIQQIKISSQDNLKKISNTVNLNNIERTCCVAPHCAEFSSGTKYIRLTNPVPYMEEKEEDWYYIDLLLHLFVLSY